jgi:hypothetical protein
VQHGRTDDPRVCGVAERDLWPRHTRRGGGPARMGPLGLISAVMWIASGYTVGRAWKRGNPATYNQYVDTRQEALRRHHQQELNRQQQEQLQRNRTW